MEQSPPWDREASAQLEIHCIAEGGFVSGVCSGGETNETLWSQGGTGESRLAQTMGDSWGEFKLSQKKNLDHLKCDELLIASVFI